MKKSELYLTTGMICLVLMVILDGAACFFGYTPPFDQGFVQTLLATLVGGGAVHVSNQNQPPTSGGAVA